MSLVDAFPLPLVLRAWTPGELDSAGFSRQRYTLAQPFEFISARWGAIEVPPGFVTDFASIPRFAWRYLDPEDPCILMPSVVHDFLYSVAGALPDARLTRDECDAVLLEAMALCGARADQRLAVKVALKLFGGSHWGRE